MEDSFSVLLLASYTADYWQIPSLSPLQLGMMGTHYDRFPGMLCRSKGRRNNTAEQGDDQSATVVSSLLPLISVPCSHKTPSTELVLDSSSTHQALPTQLKHLWLSGATTRFSQTTWACVPFLFFLSRYRDLLTCYLTISSPQNIPVLYKLKPYE